MNSPNTIPIATGVMIPSIGFGTYKVNGKTTMLEAIRSAYDAGYRFIDTAAFYKNEKELGAAIATLGIAREDLFITSKVWLENDGYDKTLKSFEKSCKDLGTDYLDLFLIHWPTERTMSTWMALERLYAEGKVRAIGVSNFDIDNLKEIVESNHIKPMINQIEIHPGHPQDELRKFCDRHGIHICSSAPLGRGNIFSDPDILQIADRNDRSPSQVVLRWHYQLGISPIPKSLNKEHIEEIIDIFDFTLSIDDMQKLSSLKGSCLFKAPAGALVSKSGEYDEA